MTENIKDKVKEVVKAQKQNHSNFYKKKSLLKSLIEQMQPYYPNMRLAFVSVQEKEEQFAVEQRKEEGWTVITNPEKDNKDIRVPSGSGYVIMMGVDVDYRYQTYGRFLDEENAKNRSIVEDESRTIITLS